MYIGFLTLGHSIPYKKNFFFILSVADHAPQSAVPSDTATAPQAESVLRPLYMDVQATTPLVRMEGQLSPRLFITIILQK